MVSALDKLIGKKKTNDIIVLDEQELQEAQKNKGNALTKLLAKKGINQVNQDSKEFLHERGLDDVVKFASDQAVEHFAKTIKSAEYNLKQQFNLNKLQNEEIKGTHRSKTSLEQIQKYVEWIEQENRKFMLFNIQPCIIDLGFDPDKELTFNTFVEGKFSITHMVFDTEADNQSKTIFNCGINWEAKRIVLNVRNRSNMKDELFSYKVKDSNWMFYILFSSNLYDACITADIETVLCCILKSSTQQGSEELIFLTQKIFKHYIPLNITLIQKLLMNEQKSVWIVHNVGYDINKLNVTYKTGRGKRNKFFLFNDMETEFIQIKSSQNELFSIKIGNSKVGFRFKAEASSQFSAKDPYFHLILAPAQVGSYSESWGIDTQLLAFASSQESAKLMNLSKGLIFEKMEIEGEEKTFDYSDLDDIPKNHTIAELLTSIFGEHFSNPHDVTFCIGCKNKLDYPTDLLCPRCITECVQFTTHTLSDKIRYNIRDCFSTLAVYSKQTELFDLREFATELGITLPNNVKPFLASIKSTATLSKFILEHYLAHYTKQTVDQVQNNIEKERIWFDNYKLTYLGGANDPAVAGTVTLTEEEIQELLTNPDNHQAMSIEYSDFRSQYPHASRLINAEKMFIESAKGTLHHYLNYNIEEIKADVKRAVNNRLNDPFSIIPGDYFEKLLGNVTVKVHTDKLILRKNIVTRQKSKIKRKKTSNSKDSRLETRQTEIIVSKGSQITVHLIDLCISIIRTCLVKNIHSDKIFEKLEFLKAERVVLGDTPLLEQELFTKLYKLRKIKEKQLLEQGYTKDEAKKSPISIQIKTVANSTYGLSAEGTSKDYVGKFLNYAIASSITACARFLTIHAKVLYLIKNGIFIYSDTDSGIGKGTKELHNNIRRIFLDTIPLDPEPKYKLIKRICVLGKKKYGIDYITQTDEEKIDVKIHGIGRKAKDKDIKLYSALYEGIFNRWEKEVIYESALEHYDFWKSIRYNKDVKETKLADGSTKREGNQSILSIKKLLKAEKIEQLQYKKLPIFIYKQESKLHCKKCKQQTSYYVKREVLDLTAPIDLEWSREKINLIERIKKRNPTQTEYTIITKTKLSACCQEEIIKDKKDLRYLVTNIEDELEKGSFSNHYYNLNGLITFAIFSP
ncbi:MAG: hypothetical protein AB1782_10800, partial [Cyanobacteriota bacterium]